VGALLTVVIVWLRYYSLDIFAFYNNHSSNTSKEPIIWSTFNPGVELSAVNRFEIFVIYMDDFDPRVEMLYVPGIDSPKYKNGSIASILFSCNK
jgi:hypothetical protein